MNRRSLILGVLAWPATLAAHEGHGAMDVLVDVAEARAAGRSVLVTAELRNFGPDAISVTGIAAAGAKVHADALPLGLPAGGAGRLIAELIFEHAAPGIFALEVAFGEAGSGPVLVMPKREGAKDD
jgi:hypothetical protein